MDVCVAGACMSNVYRDQKRALDPLCLRSQAVVSYYVHAGTGNPHPLEEQPALLMLSRLSSPSKGSWFIKSGNMISFDGKHIPFHVSFHCVPCGYLVNLKCPKQSEPSSLFIACNFEKKIMGNITTCFPASALSSGKHNK